MTASKFYQTTKTLFKLAAVVALAGLLSVIVSKNLPDFDTTAIAVNLSEDTEWTAQTSQTWLINRRDNRISQQLITKSSSMANDIMSFERPIFIRFEEQNYLASADQGTLKNQHLHLIDNVSLEKLSLQDQQPWLMRSEELHHPGESEPIYGSGWIEFEQAAIYQTGRDYVYNLELDHLTIKSEVNTHYDPSKTTQLEP